MMSNLTDWSTDLEVTGLSLCKTMPDFTTNVLENRFPVYSRIDPRFAYPYPVFTKGPFLDDCIVAYDESAASVATRFAMKDDIEAMMRSGNQHRKGGLESEHVRVIEYYDMMSAVVIAEARFKDRGGRRPFVILYEENHGIGRCPITIGVRAGSHDGAYRGTMDHPISLLNTHNRLMTYHLDAAEDKVYDKTVYWGIDPNQMALWGPDAVIPAEERDFRVEHSQNAAATYDNYNMLRMMMDFERAMTLLPDSVTGNPDESVISAAGIQATQSMPNALVVSLQRDSISPMLQAANEIAMAGDEMCADVTKTITGEKLGSAYAESYTPSELFAGDYSNDVVYGMGSGLDKVNTNVMVLQQLGAQLISKQTAMELNPFIADPQREQAQQRKEQMQDVALASIMAATQLPPGDPNRVELPAVVAFFEALDGGATIQEALKEHIESIALVPPPTPAPQGGPLASPGTAGAQEPLMQGPALDQLVV
jgi:ribosomal protein L12E/L44/L45/RPP1/RPP2